MVGTATGEEKSRGKGQEQSLDLNESQEPYQLLENQEVLQPLLEAQSILVEVEPSKKSRRKCTFPVLWTMFAVGVLVFLTCWIFSLPVFLVAVCMGSCLLRTKELRKRELSGWIANVVMLSAYVACACTFGYFAAHLVKLGDSTPDESDRCTIGCYQNFGWLTKQKE